jgi:hypothetical protein
LRRADRSRTRTDAAGDDVVDIVGIDAYDAGVPSGRSRWSSVYGQPDGIQTVLRFAAAHGKPMSIPECGALALLRSPAMARAEPAQHRGLLTPLRRLRRRRRSVRSRTPVSACLARTVAVYYQRTGGREHGEFGFRPERRRIDRERS